MTALLLCRDPYNFDLGQPLDLGKVSTLPPSLPMEQ